MKRHMDGWNSSFFVSPTLPRAMHCMTGFLLLLQIIINGWGLLYTSFYYSTCFLLWARWTKFTKKKTQLTVHQMNGKAVNGTIVADYYKHSGSQSSDMMSQGGTPDWKQPNQTVWTHFLATSKQLVGSAKLWFWQFVKIRQICRKPQTQA